MMRILLFAVSLIFAVLAGSVGATAQPTRRAAPTYAFNDCHLHLTNYVQEGTSIFEFLKLMGTVVGRAAVFGIPLQQQWSYRVSGTSAPTYYLHTDAHLYYYSFTDAHIAMAYRALPPQQRARLDPMITGFNPTDMYAADHIARVLRTFPGVFSGIGEFSIHKEFVSSKIAGDVASLGDPALDRIFDFATEAGLVVLIHNDIDVPFAEPGAEPAHFAPMRALLKRHPRATVIWAHVGFGRVVRPVARQAAYLEQLISDPELVNLHFDISWSEVAKYLVGTPEATERAAAFIDKYPDRFLFGTDEVAPKSRADYLRVYEQYAPLWKRLAPETGRKVRLLNYRRIFDRARKSVRSWEKAHAK